MAYLLLKFLTMKGTKFKFVIPFILAFIAIFCAVVSIGSVSNEYFYLDNDKFVPFYSDPLCHKYGYGCKTIIGNVGSVQVYVKRANNSYQSLADDD